METGSTSVTESTVTPQAPKNRKWLYGGIAVVVVLGAAVAGIVKAANGAPAIPNSQIYQVAYAATAAAISTQGTVVADSVVNLNFQGQGGTIKTINVKVGNRVKAGQVLATLDGSMQQSQVSQAEAGVAVAQGQLAQAQAHLQQLLAGPSAQTVNVSQSALQAAETALANAQKNDADEQNAFNDRTAQHQQLVSAQNQVAQASAALQAAQSNQQALMTSSQQALLTAQNNLATYQSNLTQAQTEYGTITEAQVQQAYATYMNELAAFQSFQNGAFVGPNPYAESLQGDQTVYQTLNQGYTTLQQDQQQYDAGLAAVQQAKSGVTSVQNSIASAQAQYDAAEKGLQEAEAAYNDRNQAQQALDNAQNAVAQAKGAVNTAKAQLAQTTQPPRTDDISAAQAAVQTAQAGAEAAQAQLQQAQVNASYTILKAPADGVITQKNITAGELVSPSQPAFVLEVNETQVNIPISEAQFNTVQQGDKISLQVPELPGQTFTGHIIEVDPTPIPENPSEYKAIAMLDAASSKSVQPGMTGSVTIALGQNPHVLTIPETSLQSLNGVAGVYVIGQQPGKAKSTGGQASVASGEQSSNLPPGVYFQPVQVGNTGVQTVQIVSGLQPGEKILLGEGRLLVGPNGAQPTEDGNS